MDSKLSFNAHIDATTKKANSTRAFLSRNFYHCNQKIKEATYMTYVRPIVEYAAAAWDPHTQRYIKKVEQVQRSSTRFVTGNYDPRSSVTSMLKVLKWPTLENRRLQTQLAMLYRIRFDLMDIQWSDYMYLTEVQSRTRGHQSTFLDTILQHTSVCIFFLPSHKPRLEQPGTISCRLPIPQRLQNSLEGHLQVGSMQPASF